MENNKLKTIGQHTLTELLPHIKQICFEYGFKLNNVKHFRMVRKILVQRYYSIPEWD